MGASLVRAHQARITDHIGGYNCRQSALGCFRHGAECNGPCPGKPYAIDGELCLRANAVLKAPKGLDNFDIAGTLLPVHVP